MHFHPATLVEQLPEWEFHKGFFFVTWDEQSWAYPPHQFFAMLAQMGKLAREYRVGDATILAFHEREDAGD